MPDYSILTLTDVKAHLALTADQDEDDMLIQLKLDGAQGMIERLLGYRLRDRFETFDALPAELREAILQLTAWWYENREAVADRGAPLPFGVQDIIDAHRDWTF